MDFSSVGKDRVIAGVLLLRVGLTGESAVVSGWFDLSFWAFVPTALGTPSKY